MDRALEPGEPYKPSLKKNLLGGGALGLMLGVGVALFLSHLDRSVRTVEQVETGLRLPALGVDPGRPVGGRSVLARPRLPGRKKEARTLRPWPRATRSTCSRTRIPARPWRNRTGRSGLPCCLSRAGGVKSLVITSALPQEGKTTTAVNLAVVLGQLGRRVLLVDADLHQPNVHEVFDVQRETRPRLDPGGGNRALSSDREDRASRESSWCPPDPIRPIRPACSSSDAMHRFLELALSNFDHVIVDTPPVLPVSDTLVFAQQTDGVVLCVRGGRTSREEVARARDLMQRGGIPILGVLINGLESGPGYRHYEYGYGPTREVAKEEIAEKSAPVAAQTS